VDQSTHGVGRNQSQGPQDQQNNRNCFKHVRILNRESTRRAEWSLRIRSVCTATHTRRPGCVPCHVARGVTHTAPSGHVMYDTAPSMNQSSVPCWADVEVAAQGGPTSRLPLTRVSNIHKSDSGGSRDTAKPPSGGLTRGHPEPPVP
jgi:hypothetical protein